MKNYFHKLGSFVLIFSFVFALSGFASIKTVEAQTTGACKKLATGNYVAGSERECNVVFGGPAKGYLWDPLAKPVTIPVGLGVESSGSNNPGFWALIIQNALAGIAEIILRTASLLTGLGGLVLNGAIYHTVVNVSENYNNLPAINEAWKVIRDIANMAFIFVLLYAAIQQILGIGKDVKGLIVRVIVVAVLINFSLFFTKFIIDMSNILALTFYDAMVPGAATKGLTGTGL